MNYIYKFFVFLFILFSFSSCEKELEYSTNFNFNFKNLDNNAIQIDTEKDFSIELSNFFDVNNVKDFEIKYRVVSGTANIYYDKKIVNYDNFELYTFSESNLLPFVIIPKSTGNIQVEVIIKNIEGIEKTQNFTLNCKDNDFRFDFSASPTDQSGMIYQDIAFSLTLKNLGQSQDTNFRIKYISDKEGILKVGNTVIQNNSLSQITPGIINCTYNGNIVGIHNIVITCVNSANEAKQINLKFEVKPSPFSLVRDINFSVKESLKKTFQFSLNNTIPQASYSIKFVSKNNCNIYNGTTIIPNDFYTPLTLNNNGIYTFDYEALSNLDDILTVYVKDSYNQEKSIVYDIDIISRPVISSLILDKGFYQYTIIEKHVIYNNANYAGFEFQKFIEKDQTWGPNLTLKNVKATNSTFSATYSFTGSSFNSPGTYRFRIKDSDGAWSLWTQISVS